MASSTSTTIDFTDLQQTIDGFGASDKYVGTVSDAVITQFFDPDAGIGLSFLRSGIDPDGSPSSGWSNICKRAQALGVKDLVVVGAVVADL